MANAKIPPTAMPVFNGEQLAKINAALVRISDTREFLGRVKRTGLPVDEQIGVLDIYEDQLKRIKAEFFPQSR